MSKKITHIETLKLERDGLKQDLPGFGKKYINIVDYILEITEDIWEKKEIDVINETYEKDILIHTGARIINGVETVITGTIDTLASFPDRKMGGEAVIWSTDNKGDFYSSHRIISTATNLGETIYGKATGKKITFRTIADCKVANNKIYKEWLVRDNLSILLQLGFDPVEMAKKDVTYKKTPIAIPINSNQEIAKQDLEYPENLVYSLITNVWKQNNFEDLAEYLAADSTLYAAGNQEISGITKIKEYIQTVLASFTDLSIGVERITSNREEGLTHIAARWYLKGKTTEKGVFGKRSVDEIFIPVLSHYTVKNGKITDEWMVYDGFDALCQIYSQTNTQI
ncbi:ester cyclase [Polaribacter sp. 11A2H]|uniref:ester cyclase n=1 Tax=Polaribacter sp. 11A2H TaxID=2687290 RepID=UPI00140B88B3|nr:ester cyclase [Polaribacter sp. 11A2H]